MKTIYRLWQVYCVDIYGTTALTAFVFDQPVLTLTSLTLAAATCIRRDWHNLP